MLGLGCRAGFFSSCGEWELLTSFGVGVSLQWLLFLLWSRFCKVRLQLLWLPGSIAQDQFRLSCSSAGILPDWDLNLCPCNSEVHGVAKSWTLSDWNNPAQQGFFTTTEPPRKPRLKSFKLGLTFRINFGVYLHIVQFLVGNSAKSV